MSRSRHTVLGLALACGVLLQPLVAPAQDAGKRPALSADVNRLSPLLVKSRIAVFRELLGMTEAERRKKLAAYAPARQAALEAKISEYLALSPEQCELRLLVTELQDCLLPLMTAPATNRAEQISMLPTNIAPMIEVRLRHWDALSPQQQKQVLENKPLLNRLTEFAAIMPGEQNRTLTHMTPAQRQALQEGLAKWQALPPEQRQEITRHFREYFQLTPAERQKTLRAVSDAERAQIQKTVDAYRGLDPKTRARVNRGLEKFCRLSPPEIREFLRNAERWQNLSPSERKAWRDLVSSASILPPYPPGAHPPPSLPPSPADAVASERVATNR